MRSLPTRVPVDPSPDQARAWLRTELAKRDYHRTNILQRIWQWISEKLSAVHDVSVNSGPWRTLGALAVFLFLVTVIAWLLTKVRRARAVGRARTAPALGDARLAAGEWRRRALDALSDGRWDAAVVDGFRAVCARALETAEITAGPGATADELARLLAASRPRDESALVQAADWFDGVLYGDRAATREQAEQVLGLDAAGSRR